MTTAHITRRQLLRWGSLATAVGGLGGSLPLWARGGTKTDLSGLRPMSGTLFDLSVDRATCHIDGNSGQGVLVNGQLPAPLLRWREGDTVTLRVTNNLDVDTSIHWHGILLPFQMDGVPGVTFPGIRPGQTFVYEFPLKQAGTYWYHSHSGLQEQSGHYGPIVIEPKGRDPDAADREYVVLLSDWTFEDPHRIFAKLKGSADNYNFQQRTLGEFFADSERDGLSSAIYDRLMWGAMRMNAADIADVTGATYTYLINGHGPGDNWTGLFTPGERVRLRFINASAMSIFNVRIPGLPMTVVHSDGLAVEPIETDEFQIGAAETFDVIVTPGDLAYTIMAESNDRYGFARATLAPGEGMTAPVPELRPRPTLTMKDMAMDHSAMGHDAVQHGSGHKMHHGDPTEHPTDSHHDGHRSDVAPAGLGAASNESGQTKGHHMMTFHGSHGHESHAGGYTADHGNHSGHMMAHADHSGHQSASDGHDASHHDHHADHSAHHQTGHHNSQATHGAANSGMPKSDSAPQAHDHPKGPGVVGLAMNPVNRLGERPLGLETVDHRVLVYTDLAARERNPDTRAPGREMELHLTSNMERYMWSFDGLKFSEVTSPIKLFKDERIRLTLVNDTMMPHPIHLHGMFFEVVTNEGDFKPRKHTIVVKPGEKVSVDITADALGDWAFHCHLLYHMHAGMMRVVSVVDEDMPA